MFEGAKRSFEKQNPGTTTRSFDQELGAYQRSVDLLDSVAASMAKA